MDIKTALLIGQPIKLPAYWGPSAFWVATVTFRANGYYWAKLVGDDGQELELPVQALYEMAWVMPD